MQQMGFYTWSVVVLHSGKDKRVFKRSSEWKPIHAIERRPSITATFVINVRDSFFWQCWFFFFFEQTLLNMHNYSWLKHYHHLLNPNAVTDRMILFLCGTQNNFFLIQQQWMVRTSFRKNSLNLNWTKALVVYLFCVKLHQCEAGFHFLSSCGIVLYSFFHFCFSSLQ